MEVTITGANGADTMAQRRRMICWWWLGAYSRRDETQFGICGRQHLGMYAITISGMDIDANDGERPRTRSVRRDGHRFIE